MAGDIKVKVKLAGNVADVKTLMLHPMETGQRRDPETGKLVPAHHITQLTFACNGETIMVANCSTAVSKDPYFSFSFSGASAGDKLVVSWVDNAGQSASTETVLK
jgi:sulfur-oxidizing protein SoxZ